MGGGIEWRLQSVNRQVQYGLHLFFGSTVHAFIGKMHLGSWVLSGFSVDLQVMSWCVPMLGPLPKLHPPGMHDQQMKFSNPML